MNCLRPLTTQPPSTFTALVCIAASGTLYGSQRSEAPRGSVRQCAIRNCGSATRRLNHFSCKCLGANWRSSTDTFQFCTILSARPESPRAISSETTAKVLTSVPFSSSTPPNSSGTPSVRMPIFSASAKMCGGSRSSGTIDHSFFQFFLMNGSTTSSTKSRQLCRIMRNSSDNPRSLDIRSSIEFFLLRSSLRRFAVRQKLAHASERLQDVLGRIGVRQPQVALAENAEIGPADDGDAGLVEQRRGERLGLPAGALDVGEGVERALGRGARDAGQFVQPLDHHFAPPVELGDHLGHFVLRPLERRQAGKLRRRVDAGIQIDRQL